MAALARRTLDRAHPQYNHDGLLLDLAVHLDVMDPRAYSHYMKILWELKWEMQEVSRPTDRA